MTAVDSSAVEARPGGLWLAFSHNKLAWVGLVLLAAIVFVAVFAPWLAPHDPLEQNLVVRLEPPSAEFWLGTDSYGRDVLSRLIYGARISLFVGFVAILIAMLVGTVIGVLAGYIGGLFDQIVMGVLDVLLAFPTLLLGLMIAAMLGASLENLIIAIAVTEVAPFARVARAPTISLRQRDFVEASRSYGCGPFRIMFPPYPAEHDLGRGGDEFALAGVRHPHRSLAQLHRPRRPATRRDLGRHDPRGLREHPRRLVARGLPEHGHSRNRAGAEPSG